MTFSPSFSLTQSNPNSTQLIPPTQSHSAAALLSTFRGGPRLSSGCSALDDLLSPPASTSTQAGLAYGSVLELLGTSGIGKSRTVLAYALALRFEAVAKGKEAEVLIVDLEGTLSPYIIHATATLYASHNNLLESAVTEVCDGIHYKRHAELDAFLGTLMTLTSWLSDHPETKLVIFDSLTSHVRPTLSTPLKTLLFNTLKSTLALVTSTYSLSFIVTTQLSVKLFNPDGEPSTFSSKVATGLLVPQLGDSWIGGPTWRVIMYYGEAGERLARLLHAPSPTKSTQAIFAMDALGPCDYPS